jgi:retron-type reverse transcriptase
MAGIRKEPSNAHPASGIASPTIANIALDGLEAALAERFGQTKFTFNRFRVRLVRYTDDFIITGNSKELLEKERGGPAKRDSFRGSDKWISAG